jgi:serine phosphatase RsbU (regulator of sigma subunit)
MTDGYADQFGGEKGKKFKYKQLKDMLVSIQNATLSDQEEIIKERFSHWKGSLEQVDDVTIIGIRV